MHVPNPYLACYRCCFSTLFYSGLNQLLLVLICAVATPINGQKSAGNISSILFPLLSQHASIAVNASTTAANLSPLISTLGIREGMVPVDITASSDVQVLLSDLEANGCIVTATYAHIVSGRCPTSALARLGSLATVNFVRPVLRTNHAQFSKREEVATEENRVLAGSKRVLAGSVQSEGVKAMRADVVQSTYGLDGTGIKIGVLSDSFNQLGGALSDIASGDLPADGVVVLKEYTGTDGTDRGRAMLQIVHDVAPGAKLYFHTGFVGEAEYASGIMKLAQAGCKVIVDDVYFLESPWFQDGIIAQAVDQVHAMGVAYFSGAGLFARQSWSGSFVDSGSLFRGYKVHNFNPSHPLSPPDPGVRTKIPIILWRGVNLIMFQWDQPSSSASQGISCQSDLDIFIIDEEIDPSTPLDCKSLTSFPFCLGGTDANVNANAAELILIDVDAILTYLGRPNDIMKPFRLQVVHKTGPYASLMQIITDGDFTTFLQTNSGTVFGHKNAKGAANVGAAYSRATPAYGVQTIKPERFSSSGGIPILFDTKGNRLQNPEIRNQPRFTGPDGVSVSGFPSPLFYESAPHVAAVAALMLQQNPSLTPDNIFGAIQATAIDMNDGIWTSKGFDFASGYGFVDAAAAVNYVTKKGKKSKKVKKTKS